MDAELENAVALTDKLIAQSDPEEAAFWIGYQWGIKHRFFAGNTLILHESLQFLLEIAEQCHSDKFLNAYACGYLNAIDGRSSREILDEREGAIRLEITNFQRMNGCSVCKHAAPGEKERMSAPVAGKGSWCNHFNKAVDRETGAACPDWAYG